MKKFLLVLVIFGTANACLLALRHKADLGRQELRAAESAWRTATQQIAEVQGEQAALAAKAGELKREQQRGEASATMDPALVDLLLTNNAQSASPEMEEKLLASFGRGGNSSGSYVLVSKAALRSTTLKPLKTFPNGNILTDAVRGVLAVTPEEQRAVEAAFTEAFEADAVWAKANMQREGPKGDLLVRYTLPTDPAFEQALTNRLFSSLNAAVGAERGELLRAFFEHYRLYEDGGIVNRTNILEVYRVPGQPGLGYRSGWKWEDSEAINTYPEPIKVKKFPPAFFFVFPGGWQEVAQREGFELPEELNKQTEDRK